MRWDFFNHMEEIFGNKKKKKYIFYFIASALLGALTLGWIVHVSPLLSPDVAVSEDIQNSGTNFLPFMEFVSFFGTPGAAAVSIVVSSLVFSFFAYRQEAFFILFAFFADAFNSILKIIVGRPRPTVGLVNIYDTGTGPSFPSGHVVHYVVFFGFLFVTMFYAQRFPVWLRTFISIFSLLLVLSVSVSRVYLGAHWMTDVIGGYLIGSAFLGILLYFYMRDKTARNVMSR